ncbi:hypothetical protein HMPREF3232_00927 [Fannyhessea vaginae]|nr:hypothetical protein HMPREF3232_00927 [Fannyhessea vaginae]
MVLSLTIHVILYQNDAQFFQSNKSLSLQWFFSKKPPATAEGLHDCVYLNMLHSLFCYMVGVYLKPYAL